MSSTVSGKTPVTSIGSTILVRLRANRAALAASFVLFTAAAVAGLVSPWGGVLCAAIVAVAALAIPPARDQALPSEWQPGAGDDPASAAMLEALLEPAILLTARGTIFGFNTAATQAVGNLKKGDPVSFWLRTPEILEAVREVGAGGEGRVVEYVDRVPVDRWTEARIGPVWLNKADRDDGQPQFVMLALHDLTHLRRAERMRVDFVANASHELRTPLAALLGFIETLQGPARNDTDARGRFLDIMKSQAARMSRLVDDLLQLSRIEQRQHLRPQDPVDLVEITKSVLDSLAPLAAERGVEIVTAFPQGAVPARGDRDELIRVVENLVENGIKYGQSGKRVDVSVKSDTKEAKVVIRDYGSGIPPEHLPRLTERFYRVDIGDSREKGGTGLGLAIVKHIMARHRGRLVIESPEGQQGAIFTAVIELDEAKTGA
jgi:two-component system phosphate regulon sensor histidine kinase PhoR